MNKEDKKLHKLAAKACGYEWRLDDFGDSQVLKKGGWFCWFPMEDSAMCMRLMADLKISFRWGATIDGTPCLSVSKVGDGYLIAHDEPLGDDPVRAMMCGIVYCAAKVGELME